MSEEATVPLIGAVLAGHGAEAAAVFQRCGAALRRAGVRLAGVRQINAPQPGSCRCDMLLEDLADGSIVQISENRGPEARGCRLDRGALAEASERVARALHQGVDLVILNKFGKAETEGAGMRGIIALAVEQGTPVLIAADQEHLPHLLDFAGGLAAPLTLSETEINDWIGAVLPKLAARCPVEA